MSAKMFSAPTAGSTADELLFAKGAGPEKFAFQKSAATPPKAASALSWGVFGGAVLVGWVGVDNGLGDANASNPADHAAPTTGFC